MKGETVLDTTAARPYSNVLALHMSIYFHHSITGMAPKPLGYIVFYTQMKNA